MSFPSIHPADLAHACGGQSTTPPDSTPELTRPARTWSQVGAEYSAACIRGAKDYLMFGGRPGKASDVAISGGLGCAMGLASKGAEDLATRLQ